jgi:hypothetical protein
MKCQLAGCVLCNCKEKPGPTRTWKYFHDAQPGHLAEPRAGCLHYTSEKCTLCLQVCNSTFCNYSIATYGIFYHYLEGMKQNLVAGGTSELVFIAAPLFSPT